MCCDYVRLESLLKLIISYQTTSHSGFNGELLRGKLKTLLENCLGDYCSFTLAVPSWQ